MYGYVKKESDVKTVKILNCFYITLFIMRVAGLEPARYRYRGILSPLCLPIPPHPHNTNGAYRARTCDPLLVRQMLSQLS